jgi:hypothetical protein
LVSNFLFWKSIIFTPEPLYNKPPACPREKLKTSTVECGLWAGGGGFTINTESDEAAGGDWCQEVRKMIHRIFEMKGRWKGDILITEMRN